MAHSGGPELESLLRDSVEREHPLSVAPAVGARLTDHAAGALEAALARVARDESAADTVLMVCARAAEIAACDAIRGWALVQRGFLAEHRGAAERAAALVSEGFDLLDRLHLGDDDVLRVAHGLAGDWLVRHHRDGGRAGEARTVLTRLLRHSQRAGDAAGEWRAVVNLLSIALSAGDLGSAVAHADRLGHTRLIVCKNGLQDVTNELTVVVE